jgi:CyaY protein
MTKGSNEKHWRIVMTDIEFLDKAEAVLLSIEMQCDLLNERTDVDIDNQRNGGVVVLTFVNQTQIVINLQKPLHEIWMATKTGGFHYRWVSDLWQDTKGNGEFFATLSLNASAQALRPLEFLG